MKRFSYHRFLPVWSMLLCLLLFACQSNKYIPENEYLLDKTKISIDNKTIDRNVLKTYQKQKPNTRIFGIWKYHLGLYNLSGKKNEKGWLKRVGEAPVIYDPFLTQKTKEEFKRYLENKGYYDAVIHDSAILRKNNKAEVTYRIITGKPYLIKSYETVVKDDSIKKFLTQQTQPGLVQKDQLFDADVINSESQRLIKSLQDNGYYKTNKDILYFEADTTGKEHGVALKLVINQENKIGSENSAFKENHRRYTFHNFYYLSDKDIQKSLFSENFSSENSVRDTVRIGQHVFIQKGKSRFKPDLLINANHLNDKGFYSAELVDRTYNEFFALRLFKLVNIRFVETNLTDSHGNPMLDCYFQLTPSMSQSYTASVEGTNSLGNLGVAGNLGYQHKNLFKGGEVFDLQYLAATEKRRFGVGDSARTFNSFETGVDAKITIPKFIAPFLDKKFFTYSTPQTFFNLAYNFQRRPDYTRTILRTTYGYQWKSSNYTTHRFNLLDVNLVKMFALDLAFLNRIENLYIKSSYMDHSISAFNYSYTYNTQTNTKSDYIVLKSNLETAGNILYVYNKLLNRASFSTDGSTLKQYHFLNTAFAQYVKLDLEYRRGWMTNKNNGLAFRIFGGAAFAFANSDQMPFERKYFSGGANGIRAWPIRTLGPGSYKASPNEFPNQSGDIKLEANAEYRFKMLGPLEGAFFVDMGNIWSLRDNRLGAEFSLDRFYKEIAVGSGVGFRYDFTYVLFRFDIGVKIHDPSLSEGERWISPGRYLKQDNLNFVVGIGYPF